MDILGANTQKWGFRKCPFSNSLRLPLALDLAYRAASIIIPDVYVQTKQVHVEDLEGFLID